MYDINKREHFTTLGELRMLLAAFPADMPVYICGADGGYLHIDENNQFFSLDYDDLDSDYAAKYPKADDDFWDGQQALMMKEHEDRLFYLFSYMGKKDPLPF